LYFQLFPQELPLRAKDNAGASLVLALIHIVLALLV
jgi:hypothetical protein